MAEAAPRRRRLSREERISEILDAAVRLVMRDGVLKLTMERIALEAGSSKGLVYNYFDSLTALLIAVYARENRRLQSQQLEALGESPDFEDIVRITARVNREQGDTRQQLIARLSASEEARQAMATEDAALRAEVVDYLAGVITRHYRLSRPVAEMAVRLALRYETLPDDALDSDGVWSAMIVGAMNELERRYGEGETHHG